MGRVEKPRCGKANPPSLPERAKARVGGKGDTP
jgi:hypothetical protein